MYSPPPLLIVLVKKLTGSGSC